MFYVENKKIKEKCVFKAASTQERDEWINIIKTGIDSIQSSNTAGYENDIKQEMDELTQWLSHFGLSQYKSALRDAGLDNYCSIKTIDNDDIESFAEESKMKKFHKKSFKKAVSRYTTYCPKCVHTCHQTCGIKDDGEKYNCWAMYAGYCQQCTHKCQWDIHVNKPYIIRRETVITYKTKTEMAKK